MSLWTVAHSRQPELLDDPALPAGDHILALETLARINALSCTARQVANAIVRMLSQLPPRNGPLRVVDLASGGGDVTIALARRLNRPGALRQPDPVIPHCHVTGIDISPRSVDRATQLAKSSGAQGVSFLVRDDRRLPALRHRYEFTLSAPPRRSECRKSHPLTCRRCSSGRRAFRSHSQSRWTLACRCRHHGTRPFKSGPRGWATLCTGGTHTH